MNTYSDFCVRLKAYASRWVGTIAVPVLKRADELEKDESFVCLLDRWYELKERHESHQRHVMDHILDPDDFWYRDDDDDKEKLHDYEDDFTSWELHGYSDALRVILRRVYDID